MFELLGVSDPQERDALIGRLYEATARHFREIRVVEIEKMEQRAKSDNRRFSVHDLAADIWDAAELEDATAAGRVARAAARSRTPWCIIPEERPAVLTDDVMFSPNTVFFGKRRKEFVDCQSRGQAELVERLANLGVSGEVQLPAGLGAELEGAGATEPAASEGCRTVRGIGRKPDWRRTHSGATRGSTRAVVRRRARPAKAGGR